MTSPATTDRSSDALKFTPELESEARSAFTQAVIDELIISGQDSEEHREAATQLAAEAAVAVVAGELQIRVPSTGKAHANPQQVAQLATQAVRLRNLGPDPVGLLVERLVKLGVPEADATTMASGAIGRHPDGRVWAKDGEKEIYDGGPKLIKGLYTQEEFAHAIDPNEAVSRLTRVFIQRYREAQHS